MSANILNVASLNVRSILPSLPEIKEIILSNNYDIFCVVETWLHAGIPDELINIVNYNLFRCDRITRGGGLCIFIKNPLKALLIDSTNTIEQLWLNINTKNESIAFGVVYKPPSMENKLFLDQFEGTLSLLFTKYDEVMCTGDFNINILDIENVHVNNLLSVLEQFNLRQIIEEPTRITESKSTLIDLVIVTNEERIVEKAVLDCDISDHQMVCFKVKVSNGNSKPRMYTYRNFNNFVYDSFHNDLLSIPWDTIFYIQEINEKVTYLAQNIVALFDVHAPLVTSRFTKPFAPWLTYNIKLMMSSRDNALQRYKKTKDNNHWQFYKELRNYVTQAIKREKRAYFESIFNNTNRNEHWKVLRNNNMLPQNKNSEIPEQLKNVNEINNFLSNVNTNSMTSDSLLNFYRNNRLNNNNFKFHTETEITILKIINDISTNATGCDGVNAKLLKLCCPHIIPHITHIINFCLINNIFPTLWKNAVITVLAKKSNPTEYKDLRGISILPTMSKIIEKIMELQLREYLNINNLLPIVQSGFRPGYSCTTALLNIMDDIITASDRGNCTALILLDFSRAFDTLNHEILLNILKYIGLSENAVEMFRNYLSNREQKVRLDNIMSEAVALKTGVPQGSILGPLLFTIYTSHLINCLKYCQIHLYADDSQLYYSFPPSDVAIANDRINEDVNTFVVEAKNHCLIINPVKSSIIVFGPRKYREKVKNEINITVDNSPIVKLDEAKSLGIILDSEIRFVRHINKSLQKAYANIKLIYANRHSIPQKTKIMLCESLVLSLFNYSDMLYGPSLNYLYKHKIQKVQNFCLRLIYGIRRGQRVSHKLKDVGWLNMYNRRLLHAANLYHKIITLKSPPYLYEKIKFRTDVHTLNIRFKGTLTPPAHQLELFKRSYSYQICKVYNAIENNLKKMSTRHFKIKYKKILLNSQS